MGRLNNLVAELIKTIPDGEVEFHNPRDGWVLFLTQIDSPPGGETSVMLDSDDLLVGHRAHMSQDCQAMRFLDRGEHVVTFVSRGGSRARSLVVRTIPEIVYANYPSRPHFDAYGEYDWEFLKGMGMLDSVNVLITSDPGDWSDDWVKLGKRVIQQVGVPGLRADDHQTAESVHEYWSNSIGWTHQNSSGIIADEFLTSRTEMYPVWVDAIRRLVAEGDRTFYPYLGGNPSALRPLLEPLVDLPCLFADEIYLREQATEEEAEKFLDERLARHVAELEEQVPGIRSKLVLVLGILCGPPESLNANPSVNFKVFMDMQFHKIATDPALRDIWGIEEYLSSYADEEYLRWAAKLYKHYCLDGRTDRATNDPYMLDHVQNPDFARGIEGWEVRPAEPGSTGIRREDGYGWLEGRYPRTSEGDDFFWMRRSSRGPNSISQPIRNLEAGRAYSVKLFVGDGLDLTNPGIHAVGVQVDDSDVIEKGSFQGTFANCYSHHIDRYGEVKTYFNHIRRVFRPHGESSILTISDWPSESDPGGPVGQELIMNFVEVEPFYEG